MSARGGGSPSGPRLGARIGRSGHLFETGGATPGRRLVIKLFPWATGLPPQVVRNFTDDAVRVANLRHPHVLAVTEAGSLGDGTPYLITDLVRGHSLEERLEQRGALPLVEVASILRGIASALSVAHAAGVIHRELRADNVFIEETAARPHGLARLLDFGVARLTAGARAAGRILRDPATGDVAPELRRDQGDGADHRADQFALAALAHRLLRGTAAPYAAPGAGAFQRLWEQPARHQGSGPGDAAAVIDAVLARAMSWQPDRRFDSVASFIYAFEAALSTPPAPAARVIPAPAPAAPRSAPELRPSLPPAAAVPRAVPASSSAPPSSLTQQFFAEGDRQEAETLAQSQAPASADPSSVGAPAPEEDRLEDAAASGTFERLPRRRAPLLAAAVLALVALAIIARAAIGTAHDDAAAWARAGAVALPVARQPPPPIPAPGQTIAPAAAPAPPPAAVPSSRVSAPPPANVPAKAPRPGHPAHAPGAAAAPPPAPQVTPAPLPPAAAPVADAVAGGGGAAPPASDPVDDEDLSPAPAAAEEPPAPIP